jgi:predicted nucleic acid-binding Zn ribbon protein
MSKSPAYQLDQMTVPSRETGKCVVCGNPVVSNTRIPSKTCGEKCRREHDARLKRESRDRMKGKRA